MQERSLMFHMIRSELEDAVGKEKVECAIERFFSEQTPYNDENAVELKRVYNLMMDQVNRNRRADNG